VVPRWWAHSRVGWRVNDSLLSFTEVVAVWVCRRASHSMADTVFMDVTQGASPSYPCEGAGAAHRVVYSSVGRPIMA